MEAPSVIFAVLLQDPFAGFRQGFGRFLQALFALMLLISLAAVVVSVIQGDREAVRKLLRWLIIGAVGFALMSVLSNMNIS